MGLHIAAMLKREDVRDAFISPIAQNLSDLPAGAVVGTSSLRRQAQVKFVRPDLDVVTFRGSVQTRLAKLAKGDVAATFLAVAGLRRLDLEDQITNQIDTDVMLPAVAQGAIGIECRCGDTRVEDLLAPLNDAETFHAVTAERVFLTRLDGSCRTPIAGLAEFFGDVVKFRGQILSPDGSLAYFEAAEGMAQRADDVAFKVAETLIKQAGPEFMAAMVSQ